jgi:alcohol dehydrogenase (cytochrome c)
MFDQNQTYFPPRVSPLVTNDIVFTGYIPFTESAKTKRSLGVILALDKETGEKLWEFNVNAAIPQGGQSIGNGMLFVPTDKIQVQSKDIPRGGGSIVAFGLP